MTQRTLAAVVLVALIHVGVNGCGSLAPPPAEVVLRFAPPTPTHLVVVTRMSVSISGPVAEGNPTAKRGQSTTGRETLDITSAAAGAAFDLRLTNEARAAGVTVRVSRAGEVQRVILDEGAQRPPDFDEVKTGAAINAAFKRFLGDSAGTTNTWRVGESRVMPMQLPVGQGATADMLTTVTLRRVTTLHRRPVAEFTSAASIKMPTARGGVLDVQVEATSWTDLTTGLTLGERSTTNANGDVGGKPGVFRIETTKTVDWSASRGL